LLNFYNKDPYAVDGGAWYHLADIEDDLEDFFTYKTHLGEEVKLYQHSLGQTVQVPRSMCPGGISDYRVTTPPIEVQSFVKPRSKEQSRVIQETADFLLHGQSGILEAPPGFGKTVCAASIISKVDQVTLVVVTKDDLMEQWRKRLIQFTDLASYDIGMIRQDTYDVEDRKVVIAMIHSLAKASKYPGSLGEEFGLVIWDEVHRLPAETFSSTAYMFSAKLRLGLSATPERGDGKFDTVHAHLGPVRVRTEEIPMTPVVGMYKSTWKVPKWPNGKYMAHDSGKTMHVEKTIAEHEPRNVKLMKLIKQCYDGGRYTAVFSSLTDHLKLLRGTAIEMGVPEEATCLYVSKAPQKMKDRAFDENTRLIFATYGMMSEGTDIDHLDCCILATPRANVKQVVGRVVRYKDGKPDPVVLDIVDEDSPVFAGYSEKRKKYYMSLGSKIHYYG
jgi:superfamily II DNA or RNA helicase